MRNLSIVMNAFIIEDEALARASLAKKIEAEFPDVKIVGMTGSIEESVALLEGGVQPDIIFMDVELSDGECFEIFRRVNITSKVIMTTAYDSYAVKAFEAGSVDYLLKPIDNDALRRAVTRCRQYPTQDIASLLGALKPNTQEYKHRIVVRFNDRIVPVRTEDISYIVSEDKQNYLYTKAGERYITDLSLDELNSMLSPKHFFKIARNAIVSMDSILSITKLNGGRMQLSLQPEPPFEVFVSRSRSEEFLAWIEA